MGIAQEFTALLISAVWEKLPVEEAWKHAMNWMIKTGIVLLCFVMCGAATFIASSPQTKSAEPQRTNAIPVKNRDVVRCIWTVT
jgi:hypothetical protein